MSTHETSSLTQTSIDLSCVPQLEPALRFLLVTDLVSFTATVQTIGDRRGLDYIRRHNEILRVCLHQESGREVAHTGDGMITSFDEAAAAVRCAMLIQRTLAEYNKHARPTMQVRIGLHAGYPHTEERRLFGSCVNVASRICAATLPDQVLLSCATLAYLSDPTLRLRDCGAVTLRGVPTPVQLYELDWRTAAM